MNAKEQKLIAALRLRVKALEGLLSYSYENDKTVGEILKDLDRSTKELKELGEI